MTMDKTYSPAEAEPRIAARWEAAGAFRAGAGARPGAEAFCIMIPPPNVTGSLHMGHAFNNTLQDILVRWHRMRGFDTLWQPGTDHAGIATQMVVERQLAAEGRSRRDLARDDFLALVWAQKQRSRGNIRAQLERLGASCDWSREAFTMTGAPGDPDGQGPNFHDAVIRVFVELYTRDIIYRGKRLVNWDPHFETAISDLEVEAVETPGCMWHFRYPLAGGETYEYVERDAEGNVTLRETRDYISIATTRPETMLGDGAVAVHPDDPRYAPILGKLCEIPVGPRAFRRLIPIIADPYPDPAFGSGAVKITGAHDFNDHAVARRAGIPCYRLMDGRGAMRSDGAPYAEAAMAAQAIAAGRAFTEAEVDALNLVPDHLRGLDRFEARRRVVAEITAEGLAVMTRACDPRLGRAALPPDAAGADGLVPLVEARMIMQPTGDRSRAVIEPMLTDQWFVDAAAIVQPAIEAVRAGRVTILPEQHARTYFNWLENIEPWCISRQLWWGHRIPVWYGLDLAAPGFADDEGDGMLDLAEMLRLLGEGLVGRGQRQHCAAAFAEVAARFRDDLAALPAPLNLARIVEVEDRATAEHDFAESLARYTLSQDPTELRYPVWRDADVLDTWFSSALWPIGTLGWPADTPELRRYYPTSVLVTGFDIIFFWVARMIMMQLAIVGEVPFRRVYVHALVRDEKGRKMSKSLGNVIDPEELVEEFGADALRFTLAATAAMGRDLRLSRDRVAGSRNFVTKLWNAARFAAINGVWAGHATQAAATAAQATVNRWILGQTARTRVAVDEALAAFRFADAAGALHAFTWGTLCDWYVEFAKPLLAEPATAAETRAVMAFVLDRTLAMLHPFIPFVTEEIWSLTGARAELLAHRDWPGDLGEAMVDPEAMREIGWVIGLIEDIRSARAQMRVPAGLSLPLVVTEADAQARAAMARNAALIARLARVSELRDGAAPAGGVTVAAPGAAFAIPLAGVIDLEAERARLERSLDRLRRDAASLRGRLDNPRFVAAAASEVVDETREQLATLDDEAARLAAALARLAG
jgi:valyl-tRNA synthetase